MLYTLGQPLSAVAVSPAEANKTIIVIPDGAVVEIPHDAPESGLVQAIWEGNPIEIFVEDVRDRGYTVHTAHP